MMYTEQQQRDSSLFFLIVTESPLGTDSSNLFCHFPRCISWPAPCQLSLSHLCMVEHRNMNPFLFIVGCPRSGTTLLQRMLNAHPQLAIAPESHWIPRLHAKPWALTPEGLVKPKLIRRLLAHPKFARLNISREELLRLAGNGQPTTYASLVSKIYDLYGSARGKTLVGDKTPDYVRTIETLHVLWPVARFVHLIRDGRDVA